MINKQKKKGFKKVKIMEKMTKRNVYEALVNYAEKGVMEYETENGFVEVSPEDVKAFAANEIELLDKKAAKAKERAAAKRAEGDELTDAVRNALTDEPALIATITAKVVEVMGDDVTSHKVTYRLRQLVDNGEAEASEIKIPGGEGQKARTLKAYKAIN